MPTKRRRKRDSVNTAELHSRLRESATFPRQVIAEIQRAARTGIYDIRGFGAKRVMPTFDDLLFLGASMSRYPEWDAYEGRTGMLLPRLFPRAQPP